MSTKTSQLDPTPLPPSQGGGVVVLPPSERPALLRARKQLSTLSRYGELVCRSFHSSSFFSAKPSGKPPAPKGGGRGTESTDADGGAKSLRRTRGFKRMPDVWITPQNQVVAQVTSQMVKQAFGTQTNLPPQPWVADASERSYNRPHNNSAANNNKNNSSSSRTSNSSSKNSVGGHNE